MKLIKNCIVIVCLSFTFFSCGDSPGIDSNKCLESVIKTFPNSKIYSKHESIVTFIVVDSNSVKIVKTGNISNNNITDVEILMERK